jgi:hypothetical protein
VCCRVVLLLFDTSILSPIDKLYNYYFKIHLFSTFFCAPKANYFFYFLNFPDVFDVISPFKMVLSSPIFFYNWTFLSQNNFIQLDQRNDAAQKQWKSFYAKLCACWFLQNTSLNFILQTPTHPDLKFLFL